MDQKWQTGCLAFIVVPLTHTYVLFRTCILKEGPSRCSTLWLSFTITTYTPFFLVTT